MKRVASIVVCIMLVLSVVLLGACSSTGGDQPSDQPTESAPEETGAAPSPEDTTGDAPSPEASGEADSGEVLAGINIKPLEDDGSGAILPVEGKGPHGEDPIGIDAVLNLITPEQKKAIQDAKYTAAICMNTTASDFAQLQVTGAQAVFDEFGIELIAVTDAEQKVDKIVADYESVMQMEPDLMIPFILDGDSAAQTLRQASEKGIKLSFIDSVPLDLQHPAEYAGVCTADNYANGRAAAQALIDYLGGKGKVGVLKYAASIFHADQRAQGAIDAFEAAAPGIEIVDIQGINNEEETATAVENILIAHPDTAGFWTNWDGPGMAAVGVIENSGSKAKVVTIDLSEDTAYSMATDGALLAVGAQHPYDQGAATAILGVAALAGIETPSFILVPGELVTRDTIPAAWERVFKSPLPDDLAALLKD